jgi:tetratricopeptide (TPR) repeat protein
MKNPAEIHALDALWEARHDAASRAKLEEELVPGRNNLNHCERWWRVARLEHFLAMLAQENTDTAAALQHFSIGEKAAQHAMNFDTSDDVAPLFWRSVCKLEAARLRGKLAAARVLAACERDLKRAEGIDDTFHGAGALRVLGRIMHLKPLLLGGDLNQAMKLYQRALQIAPHNSTTQIYYAEALFADRQRLRAREVLQQIIEAPADTSWLWEQERDKTHARSLLAATEKE